MTDELIVCCDVSAMLDLVHMLGPPGPKRN